MDENKKFIVKLADDKRYLILVREKLEDINFCLLSTVQPPIEIKVAELIDSQDSPIIRPYNGGDYKYILERLLQKANKENC